MVPAVVPKRLCGAVLFDRPLSRTSHSFQEKSNRKTAETGNGLLPLRYFSSNEAGRALDEVGYGFCVVEVEHRQALVGDSEIRGDGDNIGITHRKRRPVLRF